MPDEHVVALLQRASDAPRRSTERKLLAAAAFAEASLEDAVLVGGTAEELHTGSYRPTDIDLVGYLKSDQAGTLAELGFKKEGRHWLFEFDDGETLAVEVPGHTLDEFATEPPLLVDLEPGTLAVISINDLMMDRLLQATGKEPATFEEAVRLAVAAYDRIDWASLEERAERAAEARSFAGVALPATLAKVRRTAIRTLRG